MAKKAPEKEKIGIEKRIYPRKTLRTKIIFEDETGEGFIYFYSTDVSLGGLFLESDIPLKLGTRVFLSFILKEPGLPVRVTGQVVRVERETGGALPVVGMGVQFVDLLPSALQSIRQFVSAITI